MDIVVETKPRSEAPLIIASLVSIIGLIAVGAWVGYVFAKRTMYFPIKVTKESAGICKVEEGGKTWLLVDMTQEFILPEDVQKINEQTKSKSE